MRRIVAVLGIATVLAGVAAAGATADPSKLKVRLDSEAQLISPFALRMAVSYDCPEDAGTAMLEAAVSQEDAFANSGEFQLEVPCTGKWETLVLTLASPGPDPPAFTLGTALAGVQIFQAAESASKLRKVRVVP